MLKNFVKRNYEYRMRFRIQQLYFLATALVPGSFCADVLIPDRIQARLFYKLPKVALERQPSVP
jgi:hypothetical protein